MIFLYNADDGNDTINGFGANSTLSIVGGNYIRSTVVNDLVFAVGNDSITLFDAASLGSSLKVIGEGTDGTLYSGLITLIEGNDTYNNTLRGATIEASEGDDTISNSGNKAKIDSGDGADSISNSGNEVSIKAGDGDDTLINSGSGVEITGGLGDDLISLTSDAQYNYIYYAEGDGSDSISGFKSNDTLRLSWITNHSAQTVGNDVILSIGTDSITLLDAAGLSYVHISVYWSEPETVDNLITLSENNDDYSNEFDNVKIEARGGNDYIHNRSMNVTINGGAGDDNIINYNDGDNSSIDGGTGDDTIANYGDSVTIDGSAGNDWIRNDGGSNVTINGGDGADTIDNDYRTERNYETREDETILPNNALIDGGNGDDRISNAGSFVTINGGTGNDYISNSYRTKQIGETYEFETIFADNVSINAGEGDDEIVNWSSFVTINGGTGNDYISNSYRTKQIGETYEFETIFADNVSINAGEGDDEIVNWSSFVTINGGTGNDEIDNFEGNNVSIDSGDGNDTIYSSGAKVSINGGAGNDFIESGVSEVTVTGNKNITYIDSVEGGDSSSIFGGVGDDTIHNGGAKVTIDAGEGNDSICNGVSKIAILDGKKDTDAIFFDSAEGGDYASIVGGAGDDTIDNNGSNVTITGGAGDDQISLSSYSKNNLINYTAGDGNDTIWGLSETDTLTVSGDTYTTQVSGDDVIVKVGTGSIVLKDFRDKPKHIILGESGTSGGGSGSGGSSASSGGNSASGNGSSGNGNGSNSSSSNTGKGSTSSGSTGNDSSNGNGSSSGNGNVTVGQIVDNVVDFSNEASAPEVIDRRGVMEFEVINGTNNSDSIYAGDGGASLWGGNGFASDTLVGGLGKDTFVCGKNQGADLVLNAAPKDTIFFNDATIDDVISATENNLTISVTFNTGNVVTIKSPELLSAKLELADGNAYRFNHMGRNWQKA